MFLRRRRIAMFPWTQSMTRGTPDAMYGTQVTRRTGDALSELFSSARDPGLASERGYQCPKLLTSHVSASPSVASAHRLLLLTAADTPPLSKIKPPPRGQGAGGGRQAWW